MKKKSIVVLVLAAILSFGMFTSCSSSSSDEPHYADQDFIKSVSKGLEDRWALQDSQKDETSVDSMREAVQTELDAVEEYKTATFEDSVLQEKALNYINVLHECLDNVEYFASDDQYEKWEAVYDQRTILIKDFVDNYGLTVSEKYKSNLEELVANGKTVGAKNEQTEAIKKIVDDLDFEVEKEEYGWKTYSAVFENTTDYEIVDLSLDVNLLDSDGVIVDTQYVSAENVAKGQKARLEFETEKSFEKYETTISFLEAK